MMQAIVLVGGEGTRLRPLTYGTPKPMVPIMNVPFLARTLERLYEAEIRDVILAAGYMPQAIVDYFGDGMSFGMKITYAIEETPLGTAGALKNVGQYITGSFFVLNGDILTSLDLRAMRQYHHEKGSFGTLHLIRVPDPSPFGCVVHDENGRVTAFVEKPAKGEEPTNEINAGTYLLEREILDFIPAARRDVLSGAMPLAVEPGISGEGAEGLRGHPGVVPPVHAAADVVVDASATVGPNVVFGRGCSVGANACVRESVLWERVSVGAGAVIEEAIIASGVTIGPEARIHPGSVIGHDVTIDPGAVLEPGTRLGSPPERIPG